MKMRYVQKPTSENVSLYVINEKIVRLELKVLIMQTIIYVLSFSFQRQQGKNISPKFVSILNLYWTKPLRERHILIKDILSTLPILSIPSVHYPVKGWAGDCSEGNIRYQSLANVSINLRKCQTVIMLTKLLLRVCLLSESREGTALVMLTKLLL